MTVLIIGDAERQQIAELEGFAAGSVFDARVIMRVSKAELAAYRDMMKMHGLWLPGGFWVVYSQEIQPHAPPPGLCHHISISVEREHMLPSQEAVELILQEFGMKPVLQSDGVWVEPVKEGHSAVNVLQLVST